MEEKVLEVINELRPFLMNDGGNIEFVKIEGNILYITLQGACRNCPMQEITLKDGSKMMLSAYLTQYDVVDHLTNKKIEIGKSYKRHMACWQRVKIS